MESISKNEYLEKVSRNLMPNSKEMDFFKSNNKKFFGVIIKDLEDNDFQIIVHKENDEALTNEYAFHTGKYSIESYEKAFKELENIIN